MGEMTEMRQSQFGSRVMLVRVLVALWALLLGGPALAQIKWEMTTEYPATTVSGEGIATFAAILAERSHGRLIVSPSYDAAKKITSGEMVRAINEGRIEAGDAFAGPLEPVDPIFALSALPFLARSMTDARRLADLARPHYEKVLARHGQRLLYLTLWPATGLWSKKPVRAPEHLRSLSVRAYDYNSAEVMKLTGARAAYLPFGEAIPKIRDGSIDAVLSSGDGGAGRRLWELLPCFTEINYALPLSIAMVGARAYDGLPEDLRTAVDEAAAQTEAKQWAALPPRLDENRARMRANNVLIATDLSDELTSALRDAGRSTIEAWRGKAGPEAAAILDAFAQR
jgi:TRAP-type C4-dicarboxylate transport system substrate-binding protein